MFTSNSYSAVAAKQLAGDEKVQKAKEGKGGGEEDWVEAEIERLLQEVDVQSEDSAAGLGEEDEAAGQGPRVDCCDYSTEGGGGGVSVSALFSGYLASVGSQTSDLQTLLSDTYSTLHAATDALVKTEAQTGEPDIEQVCNELHLKLSREEAYDASQPVTPVQSGGVEEPAQHDAAPSFRQPSVEYGDTETSNVCAASQFDTLEGSVSTPVSTAEQDECKDDGRTYDNNESRETVAIAVEGTGGCQQANASTTIAHSELQNECRVTVETGNERDSAHTNENGGARAALEPDGVSVELQAALDQLEAEQSRWEEELAREQREREAEITKQIEEAQRNIAEHQKAEAARAKVLERVRLEAAVTLQAHWRGYTVHRHYHRKLTELKQQRLQRRYRAAQLVQARWRGVCVRHKYGPLLDTRRERRREVERERVRRVQAARNKSATALQARWRGYHVRCLHGPTLAALRDKRIEEAKLMRKVMDRKRNCMATRLQATWRGYAARRKYGPKLKCRMEEWRERIRQSRQNAAARIQACWRGHSERKGVISQLVQLREGRRARAKENERAAVVLQAYWRGHRAREEYKSKPKNQCTNVDISEECTAFSMPSEVMEVTHSERYDSAGPQDHSSDSGKLTVMKRLRSTLKLKEQMAVTVLPERSRVSEGKSSDSEEEEGEGEGEGEREGEVVRKHRAMTHWEAEKALPAREDRSHYQRELSSAASALSPQAWLGVVQERLLQWTATMTAWREPCPPVVEQTAPIPTARVQPSVRPLSDAQILAASPKGTPVNQVTRVVLCECRKVPDVSGLCRCPQLCSLTLTKCGLTSLTALPPSLPLADLNVQSNVLEVVDPSGVSASLRFLDLSDNRLASVHGLDYCKHLLHLDLSGNRITRLGGLHGCWRLQHVRAECNLLVSCVGLEGLPYLQTVSCAENHLPRLPGLHHCPLLTTLHLQQNNLQEAPHLPHHVLLRELRLDDNSLTYISPLCQAWLPLLQILSLAGNCITQLDSLTPLIMLHTLDISNNSLYDLPLLLQSLRGCLELSAVGLHGNPVAEEPRLHSQLLSMLPSLETVDGQPPPQGRKKSCVLSEVVTSSPVYQLCKRQLTEQDNMKQTHRNEIQKLQTSAGEAPDDVRMMSEAKVGHCMQYEALLVRHLREQEALGRQACSETGMERNTMKKQNESHSSAVQDTAQCDREVSAAVVLQAVWRGRTVRQRVAAVCWAAVRVQAVWRGCVVRRSVQLIREERRKQNWAATVIQAMYRGHWVRRRLREVIEGARCVSEEDDSFEEDINLDSMDEDLLEGDVNPLSPPTPTSPPKIRHPPCPSPPAKYSCSPLETTELLYRPLQEAVLQEAWSGEEVRTQRHAPLLPSSPTCVPKTVTRTAERVKLKERIVDEWGLKSDTTAHLMMRKSERLKKLKVRAAQRNKMPGPAKRLAAFHRQGQPAAIDAKPRIPQRPGSLHRKRQASSSTVVCSHTQRKKSPPVYQWAHGHAVVHRDRSAGTDQPHRGLLLQNSKTEALRHEISSTRGSSECSLPQLDRRVLAGHAPTLVARASSDCTLGTTFPPQSSPLKSTSLQEAVADVKGGFQHKYCSSTPAVKHDSH